MNKVFVNIGLRGHVQNSLSVNSTEARKLS